jgi:hypothetical protein
MSNVKSFCAVQTTCFSDAVGAEAPKSSINRNSKQVEVDELRWRLTTAQTVFP